MSLNNIQNTFLPYTLNGIQDITADTSTIENIQILSLNPNKVVVSDNNNFLVSSGTSSTELEYLIGTSSNIQNQLNTKVTKTGDTMTGTLDMGTNKITSQYTPLGFFDLTNKTYVDTEIGNVYNNVSSSFLNKITTNGQTVAGTIDWNGAQSSYQKDYFYQGQRFIGGSTTTTSWDIDVIDGPSGIGSDNPLQFKHFQTNKKIIFRSNGKIYSEALLASKALVSDVDGNIVSSGVDSSKIDYLDNVSSDIQTQFNTINTTLGDKADITYVDTQDGLRVLKSGDTMSGTLDMGNNKITTTYVPTNNEDLTNKSYVDTIINTKADITYVDTQDALKVSKSGDSMTGTLNMGNNKITTTYTPVNGEDLINKTYGDTTYALTSSLGNYLPLTGGTLSGNLNMGSNFVLCNTNPSSNDQLTRKAYVDTLVAQRVPRTGDISLTGDYATSGSITGAGIVSTGGVRGTFFITASGVIEYNEVSDKGKWFKIMSIDSRAYVEGHITYSVAGQHGHVHFIVSHEFNNNPSIRVVASSIYATPVVEQLRLATDNASIYNTAYVEMYLGNFNWYTDNIDIYVYAVNSAPTNSTYFVYRTKEEGTTSGFTYQTIGCNMMMDIMMNGTRFYLDTGSNQYNSGELRTGSGLVLTNMGDNRIFNGTADAYNPTSTANNLIIKSWWGIGFQSYDGGVRIGMDTRTGGAYFGGNLGVKTTAPEGDLHVQLSGAVNDYWGKLKVKTTSFWGDGCSSRSETAGTQYGTIFPMMYLNPHIVSGDDGWCTIRMGRANGVESGKWWETAVRSDGYFQIGVERSNQISININGAVNMPGNGTTFAVPNGYMTGGSLTIGSTDRNYGGGYGWNGNTACLMLECLDNTEIAIHDAGHRVASVIRYESGTNTLTMGRDMGWGVSSVFAVGAFSVGGYFICGGGALIDGNVYCGFVTDVGQGCARFSQAWDRCLIYANGYDTVAGYFYYNQGNSYGTISDRRIKEHFQNVPEEQSIVFLKALEPTSFCIKEQTTKHTVKRVGEDGKTIEEEVCPAVCSCRQDGWIAQNVLEACVKSGASKSVVNHWADYEKELLLPEEERKTLIGVSDRPILSHTVNVVKSLLKRIEILEAREKVWEQDAIQKEKEFKEYKKMTDLKIEKMAMLLQSLIENLK